MVFMLLFVLFLSACGGGASKNNQNAADDIGEDGGGDGDTDTDSDTDGDSDSGSDTSGTLLGSAELTYYWVAFEGDYDGPADTTIGTCDSTAIAMVPHDFAVAARLEGTGRLNDDRMINIDCPCGGAFDCFVELDPDLFPWGLGSADNPLVPFVSVATDTSVIPFGTVLYSPELDGLMLPDTWGVHDGCLRADDVGGAIIDWHVDWFVGLKDHYLVVDPEVPEQIFLYTDVPACSEYSD